MRTGLAECLGLDEGQIRVIAPDVGGGFGYKGILLPEEIALAWATRKLGVPLRWIEDRREGLTANANCREHHYILTAYADADGRLLALDCEATVDSGAYSAYPVLGLPGGAARSARSCRASTTSRTTAAASTRSPPTSRRSCPTAASPAPACASRWR